MIKFLCALALVTGSYSALASDCVDQYHKANDEYFTKARTLRNNMGGGAVVGLAGGGGWFTCMKINHSFVGCSALFGVFATVGSAYGYEQYRELDRLESAMKLYQIYLSVHNQATTDEALDFLNEAKLQPSDTWVVDEVSMSMEAGELCSPEADGELKTYDQVLQRYALP